MILWRVTPLLVLGLAFLACARVEPPPGGPPDNSPPGVAATLPESLTVAPGWTDPVLVTFDERISERGAVDAVAVSPRTSPVDVERGRSGLRVSLRDGWVPNTIYHVTVGPGISDLFNNQMRRPVTLVFSTGPEIPATSVSGVVTDRVTDRPEVGLRLEAIRQVDSLVYAAPTDSTGRFEIAHIPQGSYLLRAFRDVNRSRSLDSFEARDSATIEVNGMEEAIRLSIVAPDSTAPALTEVSLRSDGRVELRFDDYLDPAQTLQADAVQIADSAGALVPVVSVGRDTGAGGDTGSAALRPSQLLLVALAPGTVLVPGAEYQVTVRGVRNLVGAAGDSEQEFEVPRPVGQP